MYRLDFLLTSKDPGGTATTASTFFVENDGHGALTAGKNVPLVATAPPAPGMAANVSPRQDVGLRLRSKVHAVGEDLLVDVELELSAAEPPASIRKLVMQGTAFVTAGKPSTVLSFEEDRKSYVLAITTTRMR